MTDKGSPDAAFKSQYPVVGQHPGDEVRGRSGS
jgi:hypothetical protein